LSAFVLLDMDDSLLLWLPVPDLSIFYEAPTAKRNYMMKMLTIPNAKCL